MPLETPPTPVYGPDTFAQLSELSRILLDNDEYLEQQIDEGGGGTPPNASTTQRGVVELATNAEAVAGTDSERAVTPAALAAAMGGVVMTRRMSTDQPIPRAAWTRVDYDVEESSAGGITYSNGYMTIPDPGVYLIGAVAAARAGTERNGRRLARIIRATGSQAIITNEVNPILAGGSTVCTSISLVTPFVVPSGGESFAVNIYVANNSTEVDNPLPMYAPDGLFYAVKLSR